MYSKLLFHIPIIEIEAILNNRILYTKKSKEIKFPINFSGQKSFGKDNLWHHLILYISLFCNTEVLCKDKLYIIKAMT